MPVLKREKFKLGHYRITDGCVDLVFKESPKGPTRGARMCCSGK